MKKQRNLGVIGSPSSNSHDVFEALIRHGITPPMEDNGQGVATSDTIDWGEYTDLQKPPYNANKRDKLDVFKKGE